MFLLLSFILFDISHQAPTTAAKEEISERESHDIAKIAGDIITVVEANKTTNHLNFHLHTMEELDELFQDSSEKAEHGKVRSGVQMLSNPEKTKKMLEDGLYALSKGIGGGYKYAVYKIRKATQQVIGGGVVQKIRVTIVMTRCTTEKCTVKGIPQECQFMVKNRPQEGESKTTATCLVWSGNTKLPSEKINISILVKKKITKRQKYRWTTTPTTTTTTTTTTPKTTRTRATTKIYKLSDHFHFDHLVGPAIPKETTKYYYSK